MDHFVSRPSAPVVVRPRHHLRAEPNALVPLGVAPDGLPLVLEVRRALSVRRAVLNSLRTPEADVPAHVIDHLDALERAVGEFSTARGLEQGGYRTANTVASLLGPTLLARLLGAVSPLIVPEDQRTPSSVSSQASSFENSALLSLAVMTQAEADPTSTAPPTIPSPGKDARLRLDLDDTLGGELVYADGRRRELVFESLANLPGAHAEFPVGEHAPPDKVSLSEPREYRRRLAKAGYIRLVVPRADILHALVELGRDVEERWHEQGLVHGDIKPGNTFVLHDGVMAFDGADVRAGHLCAITTPGWSAPEQVLAQPVTPASDVYPLALMLTAALHGAIYGEERSFVVPEAGANRRRLRLMADPGVFLDATHVPLTAKARVELASFLARCLRFDPERRPPSGRAFADELAELLDAHVIPGQLTIASMAGRLHAEVSLAKDTSPAWIVSDTYG